MTAIIAQPSIHELIQLENEIPIRIKPRPNCRMAIVIRTTVLAHYSVRPHVRSGAFSWS